MDKYIASSHGPSYEELWKSTGIKSNMPTEKQPLGRREVLDYPDGKYEETLTLLAQHVGTTYHTRPSQWAYETVFPLCRKLQKL